MGKDLVVSTGLGSARSEPGACISAREGVDDGSDKVVVLEECYRTVCAGVWAGPLSLALVKTLATLYVRRPIWAVRLVVPN